MNKPVQVYKAGNLSAKIWENQTMKEGHQSVYHTISLERVYTDKQNQWQSTNSLRVGDLPKAELVLKKAYEFLVLKRQEQAMTALLETGKMPVTA